MTGDQIDKSWFSQQLKRKGKSQADLARFLNLDRSAVTRMLNGDRNMSVEEQDRIAEYLEIPVGDVALHRRGRLPAFRKTTKRPIPNLLRPEDQALRQAMSVQLKVDIRFSAV